MDYNLCKELKDAGFPQIYIIFNGGLSDFAYKIGNDELHLIHNDNDTGWIIGNDYIYSEMELLDMQKDWIKSPTLSELISACGDNFWSLYRNTNKWSAHSNSDQWDTEIEYGETPEEAVARLYLAINKK